VSEYESEPVAGLPEILPDGENLLWQASPDASGVAWRVLHANAVAAYFALLAALPFVSVAIYGGSTADAIATALRVAAVGVVALGILFVLAHLIARTTMYSITSKRVVMRYGVAFPISVNIPFNEIAAIDFKSYADETGDLALSASGPLKLSYFHLWPHARGWTFDPAQPALRGVSGCAVAAKVLVDAMMASGVEGSATRARPTQQAVPSASAHDLNAATA
jgi:membrane protein YdbS with pleckstrin-like domain